MTLAPNLKPNQFINDRYKVVTAINHGSFGSVSLAKDTWARNTLVAVKCINKQKDDPIALEEAREEIAIHKRLGHHKYICSLLDSFEDDEATYLVMEYCPEGDLYEAIRADKGPGPSEVLTFMLQLIDAVQYAHKMGVYHRDIKPENILIAQDGSVRLADWGLATTCRINSEFGVGSERYMAPELFDQNNINCYDAEKADIWSLGICLLNILFGRNPFTSASQKDKLFLDFASSRESLFDIFPTLSDDTYVTLRHSLTLDPDNRSLEGFRQSLLQVEMWTNDEDDYYYEDNMDYSNNNAFASSRTASLTDISIEELQKDASAAPSAAVSRAASSRVVSRAASVSKTVAVPAAAIPVAATAAPIATATPTAAISTMAPSASTPALVDTTPLFITNNALTTSTISNDPLATTAPPTNLLRPPYNTPTGTPGYGTSNLSANILTSSTASIPSTLHNIVPTTNNREPLRTPLNMAHQILSENLLSQSWSRTMQFTPPNPSYFDNHRRNTIASLANSGGSHGVSQSRYDNGYAAASNGNYVKAALPPSSRSYMTAVTEEEDFDDDDEVFAMDEIESALGDLSRNNMHTSHTDDTSSVYSVPSLIPSNDDGLSSVNSSRRSAALGSSNPIGYNVSPIRKTSNPTTAPVSVPEAKASTKPSTSSSPWTAFSFDDDDDDDDDFDEYEVQRMLDLTQHSFSRTPMFPSSLPGKDAHAHHASPLRSEVGLGHDEHRGSVSGGNKGSAPATAKPNGMHRKDFGPDVPSMMSRNNQWAVPTLS